MNLYVKQISQDYQYKRMSFIFPDAGRIANIGHINAVSKLSTDQLQDYVMYVKCPKDSFFNDTFEYCMNGNMIKAGPDTSSNNDSFINMQQLHTCFNDEYVHLHHGSKHTIFKYIFPIGSTVSMDVSPDDMYLHGRAIVGQKIKVTLYGVFLDASTGVPLPPWSRTNDGAVEVLYEYFSNEKGFLTTSVSACKRSINELLLGNLRDGISFRDTSTVMDEGYVISYGGVISNNIDNNVKHSVIIQNNDVCFDKFNAQTITATWENDASPSSISLIRASTRNVQTLAFAVIHDDTTSPHGITDAYVLYRCIPQSTAIKDHHVLKTNTCTSGCNDITIQDEGVATYNLIDNSCNVWTRKLFTTTHYSIYDPDRAVPIIFPPIEISVHPSFKEGRDIASNATKRSVLASNIHKASPICGLGLRLLQIYSVTCRRDYDTNRAISNNEESICMYDINSRLSSEVDMSQEPFQTHDAICHAMKMFFEDADKRTTFLNDFNVKFPGILTSRFKSFNDAIRATTKDNEFALAVYLTIEFCTPDMFAVGGMTVSKINSVPIVFRLY